MAAGTLTVNEELKKRKDNNLLAVFSGKIAALGLSKDKDWLTRGDLG